MFPLGDSPNPRGLALVTWAIIAANVIVYVMLMPQMGTPADPTDPRLNEYIEMLKEEGRLPPEQEKLAREQLTQYDLTVYEWGNRPAQWTWLTMFTSMFLHGGFMHLFGNMLFLWIYGNNVEHRLGKIGYLVAYLATGFAASFGDMALRPDSNIPGVGASGAISGVLGMYFLWFPKNKVKLAIFIPPMVRMVDVGARLVLGFYIIAQNIIPAALSYGSGGGGVAYGAHIGGFIAGVLVAWVVILRGKRWPSGDKVPPEDADPKTVEPGEALRLGTELGEHGDYDGALAAYAKVIEKDPYGERTVAAHLGSARILAGPLRQPTAAYQHLVSALESGPSDFQIAEARQLMGELRPQFRSVPRYLMS